MAGGWAFVGTSSTATPGGSDKEVQFNDGGTLGGDADFTWDKTGNLLTVTGAVSASTTITAASFYGDGSNITGLTASAVNVADGPEFSLQFRRNTPVEGEISGSSNLMFLTGSTDTLSLTGSLEFTANGEFGTTGANILSVKSQLSASGGLSSSFAILHPTSGTLAGPGSYLALDANNNVVVSAGDGATTAAAGSDTQIQFNEGGSAFGADADFTWNKASNLLSVTGAIEVSASIYDTIGSVRFATQDASLGLRAVDPGDGSDEMYLQLAHAGARVLLSGALGVEMMADTTEGVRVFGAPFKVIDDADTTRIALNTLGQVSASGNITGSNFHTLGEVSASANISGSNVFVPSGNSVFFSPDETFKITNNGTNLDVNGASIILNAASKVSASANTLAPSLTSSYTQLGEVSAHKTTVLSQLTASTGLSASFAILHPTSGSLAGPGSYLGLDAFNNLVVSTAGGGGSADAVFTEINATQAATTSSIAIGKSTAPDGVFQVSGSGETGGTALVKVSGDAGNNIFVVTGSGRVGIGTAAPARTLEIVDPTSAAFQLTAENARGVGNDNSYSFISDGYGFSIYDTTTGGTPGYRFLIADGGGSTTRGYVGIGDGVGISAATYPTAQLHVSSSDGGAAFRVDGALGNPALFVTGSGLVGIGTASPTATLTVAGSASFSGSGAGVQATSGRDVYFGDGGERSIGAVHIDFGGGSVDYLMVRNSNGALLLTGSAGVEIEGTGGEEGMLLVGTNLTVAQDESDGAPRNFIVTATTGDVRTSGSVGIGVPDAPKLSLDVHYTGSLRPENLSNDTGGGEVVYFGTASAELTAGGIYYLNSFGGWESVNSANTGSGHNQLLGISLGTKPSANGVLVKGYFDVHTFYSGSFVKGGPMYIQSSSAGRGTVEGGYLSGAAPTAADSYVRVVGYGTDTANVIYFNPDSTYVEIG